jgi:hypothetical protein
MDIFRSGFGIPLVQAVFLDLASSLPVRSMKTSCGAAIAAAIMEEGSNAL